MATEDNVRFVRYLFELGVGGRQALREIIIREVSSRSQPLENLLSENRHRFKSDELLTQLFQADGKINTNIEQWDIRLLYNVIKSLFWSSISSRERGAIKTLNSHRKDVQRNPDGTSVMEVEYRTIRDDLRTAIFDIAEAMDGTRRQQLRAIVSRSGAADLDIQFALRQICELNEFADDLLQSLEQRFRETNRGVDRRRVNTSFRAVGAISKNVEVEENSDVQNQENDTYMTDIHGSALEIQETNNNAGFHQVHSDFSIGTTFLRNNDVDQGDETSLKSLVETRDTAATSGQLLMNLKFTGEAGDSSEVAASGQLARSIQETGDVNENEAAALINRHCPEDRERINQLSDLLKELIRLRNKTDENSDPWQNIDTKIHVKSDTASNTDAAETSLIRTVNNVIASVDLQAALQAEERAETPLQLQYTQNDGKTTRLNQNNMQVATNESLGYHREPQSDTDSIVQRVLRRLDLGDGSRELIEGLLQLCIEIQQNGNVFIMSAGEGCVVFVVKCRTYSGVYNFLRYFNSPRFQIALDRISGVLQRDLGIDVMLVPFISDESLRNLKAYIDGEFVRLPRERSFALKVGYSCITDLSRLKRYLQSDKAKETLKKISVALTRLNAGQTNLATSIDAIQMKEALKNRNDRLLYSIKI